MFLDLSNIPQLLSVFKLAHVSCPKAMQVCNRLSVRGFPTISVLDGERAYDYQGKLTVADLSKFISDKKYLSLSKPRRILHLTSAWENLVNALNTFRLKLRAFTMLLFRLIGLGHLDEDFCVQVIYVVAITPFLIFLIALYVEQRQNKAEAERKAQKD